MQKKKQKKKVRKPSFFLYYIIGPFVILWYRIKTKLIFKHEKIRKGSIILAPHRSYFDFLTIPIVLYPTRANIVSTTYWYRNKYLAFLLNILGTIPKDQYKSDMRAIINMGDVIKRKGSILMFPEGQMSPYGKSLSLPNGLDKLIKKYQANVYFINTNGSYLNSPKWSPKFGKRGVISCETKLIIKSEDLSNLSLDEIKKCINDAFKENDDLKWIKNHQEFKYKRNEKIKGLENVLLYCPNCKSKLSYTYQNNKITCSSCSNVIEFEKDSYNLINSSFKDLGELFNFNDETLKDEVQNGLILKDEARITYYKDDFLEHELFYGIVKMDKDYIMFINEKDETQNVIIDLKKVINFVITLNKSFEVPTSLCTYRIYTKNNKNCIMYWNYLQKIKESLDESNN